MLPFPTRPLLRLARLLPLLILAVPAIHAAETPARVPSEKLGSAYLPERRFIWHEIQTTDIAAAVRFYESVFKWTKIDAPTVKGDRPYAMLQRDDNVFAGIVPLSEYGSKASPRWLAWIGVSDVDAALTTLIASGGLLEKAPFDHLIGRVAFVGDPAQARFAIVRPHFRQPFILQQPLTWHALHAPREGLDALPPFYKTVFNWESADIQFALRTTLPVFTADGVRVASLGLPSSTPDAASRPALESATWQTYVEVDDLRATLARFAAGGGRQLASEDDVTGFGKIVRVADPQGAELTLFQRAPQNL